MDWLSWLGGGLAWAMGGLWATLKFTLFWGTLAALAVGLFFALHPVFIRLRLRAGRASQRGECWVSHLFGGLRLGAVATRRHRLLVLECGPWRRILKRWPGRPGRQDKPPPDDLPPFRTAPPPPSGQPGPVGPGAGVSPTTPAGSPAPATTTDPTPSPPPPLAAPAPCRPDATTSAAPEPPLPSREGRRSPSPAATGTASFMEPGPSQGSHPGRSVSGTAPPTLPPPDSVTAAASVPDVAQPGGRGLLPSRSAPPPAQPGGPMPTTNLPAPRAEDSPDGPPPRIPFPEPPEDVVPVPTTGAGAAPPPTDGAGPPPQPPPTGGARAGGPGSPGEEPPDTGPEGFVERLQKALRVARQRGRQLFRQTRHRLRQVRLVWRRASPIFWRAWENSRGTFSHRGTTGSLRVGFPEPHLTGVFTGLYYQTACMFFPPRVELDFQPVFTGTAVGGHVQTDLGIHPWRIGYAALAFVLDREVWSAAWDLWTWYRQRKDAKDGEADGSGPPGTQPNDGSGHPTGSTGQGPAGDPS